MMLSTFGAVDGVDALGPERQPLQLVGGLFGGQVDEERVQPRPGEDPQTVHLGRLLLADPERDLHSAGGGARAGLHRAVGAVVRGRNGEADLERVLVGAGHERRSAAGRVAVTGRRRKR